MTFFSTILASDSMSARVVVPLLVFLLGACSEQRSGAVIHELSGQTMGTSFSVKLVSPGDDLDKTFKLSSMLPTEANKNGAGDDELSADELWTDGCNLAHDMVSLSDMDPHVILTVFLPALLFESAAFGVDVRATTHRAHTADGRHAHTRARARPRC